MTRSFDLYSNISLFLVERPTDTLFWPLNLVSRLYIGGGIRLWNEEITYYRIFNELIRFKRIQVILINILRLQLTICVSEVCKGSSNASSWPSITIGSSSTSISSTLMWSSNDSMEDCFGKNGITDGSFMYSVVWTLASMWHRCIRVSTLVYGLRLFSWFLWSPERPRISRSVAVLIKEGKCSSATSIEPRYMKSRRHSISSTATPAQNPNCFNRYSFCEFVNWIWSLN